jgi:hypothetical protein
MHGARVLGADSAAAGMDVLARESVDLVVQDMNFRREATTGEEGVTLFRHIRSLHLSRAGRHRSIDGGDDVRLLPRAGRRRDDRDAARCARLDAPRASGVDRHDHGRFVAALRFAGLAFARAFVTSAALVTHR